MNKHLVRIIGGTICLLVLAFLGALAYDLHLEEEREFMNPNGFTTYYWDRGYFKFDPETILASLESGDTNIFMPLLIDGPGDVEEIPGITISWTQADFLKIASAVGQLVWNDPMDLKDWSMYSIVFEGSCSDSIGFYRADITYFETRSKGYDTRLIEIDPYFGWVRWGGEKSYPKPILRKWKSVDLLGAKVTADDALRIVGEDAKERFQLKDCHVLMDSRQNIDPKSWNLCRVS